MKKSVIFEEDYPKVERLLHISKTKALLPDKYIPWDDEENGEAFMPDELISLHGTKEWDLLTPKQKIDLGRHELGQVVYSYAWAEGTGCYVFNNRLIGLEPTSLEYKYLMRMSIEEYQHQEMFVRLIDKINVKPFTLPRLHHFMTWYVKNAPQSHRFVSLLTVELMAEAYGKITQQDKRLFRPVRKVSQLHRIEEGRHIYYTTLWLKKYFLNANWFGRTNMSIIVLGNLLVLKSLYVREEIFELIGVENPKHFAKVARKNLHKKFAMYCIDDSVSLVKQFNGFNFFTKFLWKTFLNVKP